MYNAFSVMVRYYTGAEFQVAFFLTYSEAIDFCVMKNDECNNDGDEVYFVEEQRVKLIYDGHCE